MDDRVFPGWHAAPDDTATHWDTVSGKWYRETGDNCTQANNGGGWYLSSFRRIALTAHRFLKRAYPLNTPPTTHEVTFTMSEEQAKELALDARPMKVVTARFSREQNAKEYHYFAPADTKTGDYAIVYANDNIIRDSAFPFSVVQIVSDEVVDTSRATKAILGTFNEDFAKHVQARVEHMARVKAKLQAKKKQFEEAAIFEMLATKDLEAAALLAELKTFNL